MINSKTVKVIKPTHFRSHTDVLLDHRDKEGNTDTAWRRISRRECKATRAFYSVQEAYGRR